MIRSGDEYRESVRDGRGVWLNGQRIKDVPMHPAFKPLVDIRARIFDVATGPKGDRSKPPQGQDPDMLLHVVKNSADLSDTVLPARSGKRGRRPRVAARVGR